MEFKHIYYFVKIAEYSNVTKAAHALYISQQALSKLMTKLEQKLGVRLFVRSSTGVTLTDDGLFLYEQFQKLVKDFDIAAARTSEHFSLSSDVLRFGVCPGVFRCLSVSLLIDYQTAHPNIKLEQLEQVDQHCEKAVRLDEQSFALTTRPHHLNGLQFRPLHHEGLVFIASKQHPLAAAAEIYMHQLIHEKFLFFIDQFNISETTLAACKQNGFNPQIVYRSGDVNQLVKLAADGLGILICVKHVYEQSNHENLVCIPIAQQDMYWEVGVLCRDFSRLKKTARHFINYLIEEAGQEN